MNTEDTLSALLMETAEVLLERIRAGSATASELAVAAKLCKDNDINVNREHKEAAVVFDLAATLPVKDPNEIEA
jgi:hypothetical protein